METLQQQLEPKCLMALERLAMALTLRMNG
jgi:hypothetical protein